MKNLKYIFSALAILMYQQKSSGQETFLSKSSLIDKHRTTAQSTTAETCKKLAQATSARCIERDKNSKVEARLNPVIVSNNQLFYKVIIDNRSNISFDLDFVRFYIRDIETTKRTVTQEREIRPVNAYGSDKRTVNAKTSSVFVFAFEKFTLSDNKTFFIEIYEKGGGRNLLLKVKKGDIVRAKGFSTTDHEI